MEFNDNRISLYAGQQGKCYITNEPLRLTEIKVHHKIPKWKGGKDNYKNLILVNQELCKLINETNIEKVKIAIEKINLCKTGLEKLIKLRKLVGNCII